MRCDGVNETSFTTVPVDFRFAPLLTKDVQSQPFIMTLLWVLRHLVQMYTLSALPSRIIVARCTFMNHLVRVRLFEWLTLFPDCPVLSHS